MSLIISIEDLNGKDVGLEVFPEDTFQEFINRASQILGYELNSSYIAGDNPISPDDSVYEYLLQMAALQQENESGQVEPEAYVESGETVTLETDISMAEAVDVPLEKESNPVLCNTDTDVRENGEVPMDSSECDNNVPSENVNDETSETQGINDAETDLSKNDLEESESNQDDYINERKKIESDLLSIFNKSAGVVKTLKLNDDGDHVATDVDDDVEEVEYLEEHLDEDSEEHLDPDDDTEEGEIVDDSHVDRISHSGSTSSGCNKSIIKTYVKSKKSKLKLESDEDIFDSAFPVSSLSECDYTDVEFLDEEIIEQDKTKIVIKEEAKEPDLEDKIDSYTIMKVDKEGKQMNANRSNTEIDEIVSLVKTEKSTQPNEKSQKPVYTTQQLLNLLEGASDSESDTKGSKSKKRKFGELNDGASKNRVSSKQEKINRNDFSREFEKVAKMSSPTCNIKPLASKQVDRGSIKKAKIKSNKSNEVPTNKIDKSESSKKSIASDLSNIAEDFIPGGYPCRLCNKAFNKLLFAITHTMVHKLPGKTIYPCVLCDYGFQSYPLVRDHMRREHINGTNISMFSKDKSAKKKNEIKKNVALKKKVEPVVSPPEEEEWLSDENIEMLEEWLEDDADTMPSYEYEMLDPSSSDEIKEELIDEEEWTPQPKYTKDAKNLLNSKKRVKIEDNPQDIKHVTSPQNECDHCRRKFKDSKSLHLHACPKSDPMLTKEANDEATILVVGTSDKELANECVRENLKVLESYRCAMCGQAFPTTRRLVYHRSVHQAELIAMERRCQECGQDGFASEMSIYDHINQEHNNLFVCTEPNCNKEFKLRSSLKIHGWVHGKKRLKCDVCFKQFLDSQTLKDHKITHLKVKPFQCHICLKFINRRNRLRMHLLAHEAKPRINSVMTCRHCDMGFRSIEDAREHVFESEECCYSLDPEGKIDLASIPSKKMEVAAISLVDLEKLLGGGDDVEISNAEDENKMLESIQQDDNNEKSQANLEISNVKKSADESINDISDFINSVSGDKTRSYGGVSVASGEEISIKKENINPNDIDKETSQNENEGAEVGVERLANSEVISDNPDVESAVAKSADGDFAEEHAANFKSVEELLAEIPEPLKVFIGVVQVSMVFRCEYCEKVFCTKESLNKHRPIHRKNKFPYECNVCHQSFETFARVTSHKVGHGFYKIKSTEEGDIEAQEDGEVRERSAAQVSGYKAFPVVKYFLCQLCGRTFLHHTYYSVHVRTHHGAPGESSHSCSTCRKTFPSSQLLRVHLKRSHGNKKVSSDEDKPQRNTKPIATNYRCSLCSENFTARAHLAKHLKEKHDEEHIPLALDTLARVEGPFRCNICRKAYHTRAGLQGHIRVHKGMLYLCALCGSGFGHQAGLATHHKRVHLRDYSHSCEECGHHFFTSAELINHMRSHTGEKPFPCSYCNMSFRTMGRRREHIRIHTGERPFPCDVCGLAFRRNIAMKNHRLIHTGHRPHVCGFCGNRFHIKSALRSHLKSKHSTKYLFLKIKGGDAERTNLTENLNSLIVHPKEALEVVNVSDVSSLTDKQPIILSLDSINRENNQEPQYIMYETDVSGENLNAEKYQIEEVREEDGQLKYEIKLVSIN